MQTDLVGDSCWVVVFIESWTVKGNLLCLFKGLCMDYEL
jgi:hypothetical protein